MALAAVFVVACGGRQTPAPPDAVEDPIVLYEAMLDRLETLDTTRMRAVLEYYGEGGRARVRQVVLAGKPDRLRIETLSPFDTTLNVFIVGDGMLVYYDLQSGEYVSGASTRENVARFVPFWMTAEDLVRVLLGGPPLDAASGDLDDFVLAWDRREGAYRLTVPLADGGALDLLVAHETWTLAGAELRDAAGDALFELRAGNFETVELAEGATTMPTRLRFVMPSERVDISLDIERVELNVDLPDALFRLEPPPGATRSEL